MIASFTKNEKTASVRLPVSGKQLASALSYIGAERAEEYGMETFRSSNTAKRMERKTLSAELFLPTRCQSRILMSGKRNWLMMPLHSIAMLTEQQEIISVWKICTKPRLLPQSLSRNNSSARKTSDKRTSHKCKKQKNCFLS